MDKNKVTVRRKMSKRDYINLVYYLETGDRQGLDLSDYDPKALGEVEIRYFRVTADIKRKIDEFFKGHKLGISVQSILDSTPRLKRPYGQPQQVIMRDDAAKMPDIAAPVMPNDNTPMPVESDVVYEVLSDEDRWDWAKQDREKIVCKDWWTLKPQPQDYPFIKDPNKAITLDNFDTPMAIWMCERGKVSLDEITALCKNNNAGRMMDTKPNQHVGMPAKYMSNASFTTCFMYAEDLSKKYQSWQNEPEPSDSEVLDRYKYYLTWHLDPVHKDFTDCVNYMDKFVDVDNNSLVFSTDDDDDIQQQTLTYDNLDELLVDLLMLNRFDKFNMDNDITYVAFGKKISVNKYVKDVYKKYPNGLDGKSFYKSNWEAFEAGALEL